MSNWGPIWRAKTGENHVIQGGVIRLYLLSIRVCLNLVPRSTYAFPFGITVLFITRPTYCSSAPHDQSYLEGGLVCYNKATEQPSSSPSPTSGPRRRAAHAPPPIEALRCERIASAMW